VIESRSPLPLQHLDALNRRIRDIASATPLARVAEVYGHFLGHGVAAPDDDRWYWRRSLIEPSAMGAREGRRVWLEALEAAAALAERLLARAVGRRRDLIVETIDGVRAASSPHAAAFARAGYRATGGGLRRYAGVR
jgi:hypothetical protein